MTALEDRHRIAVARELTYAAGVPLRDSYGFAASDETVLGIVAAVATHPDDQAAVDEIGAANAVGEIEVYAGGSPTDEEYELRVVAALRPLIEQRREAAAKGLR